MRMTDSKNPNAATDDIRNLCNWLDSISSDITRLASIFSETLKLGGTIYWCGNGGSSSQTQHLSAELIGRFNVQRKGLRSHSLNSDTAAITCISNDFSFDDLFSRQIKALCQPHDLVVFLSTSGKSQNIINGLQACKSLPCKSVAFLGKEGGDAAEVATEFIIVPSSTTARIQEFHLIIGHLICEMIDKLLGYDNK